MAQSIKGLRLKPTYEQLIGVAVSDELRNIKFPNRDSTFLRNGFVLSQLDNEGMRAMELQQEMASKEAYKEHLLRQIARNNSDNSDNISHHSFRTANENDLREQRIINMLHNRASEALQNNNTEFYDISDNNTAEGGTQTDQLPSNDNYIHVEDHRMQIEALQQEAYNRETYMLANHELSVRQVRQDLRRRLYEISGDARRRDIENQAIIDDLVSQVNQQEFQLQAIADQPRLQAISYQPPVQAIENQPAVPQASSSSSSNQAQQPAQPTHLFGKSLTGLLTIKGKTKGAWGKANKAELQSVLRDFNIPFEARETNQVLFNRLVHIFENNNG